MSFMLRRSYPSNPHLGACLADMNISTEFKRRWVAPPEQRWSELLDYSTNGLPLRGIEVLGCWMIASHRERKSLMLIVVVVHFCTLSIKLLQLNSSSQEN